MFIEVFTEKDKNELLEAGYKFLRTYKAGSVNVFVFTKENKSNFSELKAKFKLTNKLNF